MIFIRAVRMDGWNRPRVAIMAGPLGCPSFMPGSVQEADIEP